MSLALHAAGVEYDGRWLVRDATLRLETGRVVALVGPNGSGKSTLLRLLAGVWRPSAGAVRLDGTPLSRFARRDLARRVSLVPQETHVAFAFSVREVVSMGRHAHLGRFERERAVDREAIGRAMARADVAHLAERRVNELSGGERQRVLVARSLATDATYLLLDEPTANLDVAHALDLLALCQALAEEGRAVAVALHDLNSALRFSSEAVLLQHGRIAGAGPTREVLTPEAVAKAFDVRAVLSEVGGGTPILTFTRPGAPAGSPSDRPG